MNIWTHLIFQPIQKNAESTVRSDLCARVCCVNSCSSKLPLLMRRKIRKVVHSCHLWYTTKLLMFLDIPQILITRLKVNAWQPVMRISTPIHFHSHIRRLSGWPVVGICTAVGLSSTRGAYPKNFGKRFRGKPCGLLQPRYVAVNRETFCLVNNKMKRCHLKRPLSFPAGHARPVELRMPNRQTRDSIKTLVVQFRLFPLFLNQSKSSL